MDTDNILQALKAERDRLSAAISVLEGTTTSTKSRKTRGARTGGITPEGRRRLSEMMKKRWAARRRAAKG